MLITKGYIKDTFDFLSKLNRNITEQTAFLSLDVTSLYTVIPHDLGLEALQYWITTHHSYIKDLFITFIDDVYDIWWRLRRRKEQFQPSGVLRFRDVLAWRSIEIMMTDTLAAHLVPGRAIPHYVIAVVIDGLPRSEWGGTVAATSFHNIVLGAL